MSIYFFIQKKVAKRKIRKCLHVVFEWKKLLTMITHWIPIIVGMICDIFTTLVYAENQIASGPIGSH